MIEIVREQTLFRQSALFVEVIITLQKNVSKRSGSKSKKLVRIVLMTVDEQNRHLKNALDVDLKIT